jgi:vancomycin resistance protein VanW
MIVAARHYLRRVAPEPLRALAAMRRAWRDQASGDRRRMIAPDAPRVAPRERDHALCVTQPIRRSAHWQGKLANLRLAASRFHGLEWPPDRLFSFWSLLGRPSAANGFSVGRSLRADRLEADVGGGLCQISGLIYELALRAGMGIVERHAHTRDIYSEETRFTPLGLDATVVWGHKDLRLRNTLGQTVALAFVITDDTLEGRILTPAPIAPAELVTERRDDAATMRSAVSVWRSIGEGKRELVSRDEYVRVGEAV